jgi:hypothetical protein
MLKYFKNLLYRWKWYRLNKAREERYRSQDEVETLVRNIFAWMRTNQYLQYDYHTNEHCSKHTIKDVCRILRQNKITVQCEQYQECDLMLGCLVNRYRLRLGIQT